LSHGYFFDPYARLKSALYSTTANSLSSNSKKSSAASAPLDNFYRFQVRQKRSNEVDELKRKFEDDKRRIAELKKNKIFAVTE
jgi:ribosomal RNA-processing protein 7